VLDYSHPTDTAAPAVPGRDWGTAQTIDLGGGLPDIIPASLIATVSAWFKKTLSDSGESISLSKSLCHVMVRWESDVSKPQPCNKQEDTLLL